MRGPVGSGWRGRAAAVGSPPTPAVSEARIGRRGGNGRHIPDDHERIGRCHIHGYITHDYISTSSHDH